ncbi:MAG: hypothetical protein P8J27_15855 [Mariniblastus sp.]|nr:hypothetical protein [Mariniblastus sp.]
MKTDKFNLRLATLLVGLLLPACVLAVEDPLLCVKGKLVLHETFSGEKIDARWSAAKGDWKVADGSLQGAELKADNHSAVIRTDIEFTSAAVIAFDFKFEGGTVIHCSFNGKGHICRATLTPQGYTLKGEKVKKDPQDKSVTVGQVQQTFVPGKWYTMQIDMAGKEFVARVGDGPVAFGSHEKIARDKNNFGFPMAGASSQLDNIKVWEGKLNPAWSQIKSGLPANKIVPVQPPSPKQRFAKMDKDKSGSLSLQEFIGNRPAGKHEAVKKQFQRKDKNTDGSLSLAEYLPKQRGKGK